MGEFLSNDIADLRYEIIIVLVVGKLSKSLYQLEPMFVIVVVY